MTNLEQLLTPDEAAARLNVSPWTVRRLARQGDLPYIRVGRQMRFDAQRICQEHS
jgi:excisionase family DNA binding protein